MKTKAKIIATNLIIINKFILTLCVRNLNLMAINFASAEQTNKQKTYFLTDKKRCRLQTQTEEKRFKFIGLNV